MSSEFMRKTADVLEKLAEHIDQEETRHQSAIRAERLKTAQALGEKIATVTGEEVSSAILEKIASADDEVLETFKKLAGQSSRVRNEAPDEPGDVGDMRDNNTASYTHEEQVKEASEHADRRFVDWIMS